jgi:acetyl/propionyl-CoA carboxylase alpha subunit
MGSVSSVLIANRGEIAVRVARACADVGARSVACYAPDDAASLHVVAADGTVALPTGYLDIDAVVAAALASGCDAVHPGYGFLAENPGLARACAAAGLTFVGPTPDALDLFGDKTAARDLAASVGVPVLRGGGVEEAAALLAQHGAVMVKALAGGGGRGMRVVDDPADLEEALSRASSEAFATFGNGALYVEQYLPAARHVEVQILGDDSGAVTHLGERECSLQRRHQKIVEIAPSPSLPAALRDALCTAAVTLARAAGYRNAGTVEFLVSGDRFFFIEGNARIQVEHTVTEEVTGVDLVAAQLRLAGGATLDDLGLGGRPVPPRGYAVQVRVNTETMAADGSARPAGGVLSAFQPPSGPGVRVDTYGYAGYATSPRYDSLLAKVIAWAPNSYGDAVARAGRALAEFRIEGVATNAGFLRALLADPAVVANDVDTRYVEANAAALVAAAASLPNRWAGPAAPAVPGLPAGGASAARAGAKVDAVDPLAVLAHGKSDGRMSGGPAGAPVVAAQPAAAAAAIGPEGTVVVPAPMQGTIVAIDVVEGDTVRRGQQLLVMEAMKMEHVIAAEVSGVVRLVGVAPGDTIYDGHPLLFIEEGEVAGSGEGDAAAVDLDHIRPDLADLLARKTHLADADRPDAVERRRKTGQRTARENLNDLVDPGSYLEYGGLVVAAQRKRRSLDDLIDRTPADGMIAGIGSINGALFGEEQSRAVIMSYDYTVLAGTQGTHNHLKKDRLFELAERHRLPVVFFTEGGGGRPGDTDGRGAGLDCLAFAFFGRLSGLVPLVGINSGRCFAGNAALLGCCDVVIATENSTIGMGGPAMIEGGGLGVFRPEEVGPMSVQVPNGVVDITVKDEAEAVAVAKQYLSYFQGPVQDWTCDDQRKLRFAIPENRLRVYEVRDVIWGLADIGSVLELRPQFGVGMVTALVRVEGRPLGIIANNPKHLGGAIDSDGADKAARFMQLCDAFDVPLLFLADTPGMMVGPEVEKTALVRHCSRMFVTGASLTVPFFTIVLRKGYGLGVQAMAGGSFKAGMFTVAWPTGEFGGMGLEGAVKLGYRNELAAIDDPYERKDLFEQMVAKMYEHGKALSTATIFEIDDVIDPADTRFWISRALRSVPPPPRRDHKKRPCIDTW